jgi:anti-sigma-K factor RskA
MNDSHNPSNSPWSELLAGYVLGDLSSDDIILVQQYLDSHPDAIVEVEELQTTLGLLPLGLDDVPVPSHIKTNLFATLPDRAPSAPVKPRSQTLETKVQQRWFAIAGSIAAVTIAALGLQSYQLQQEFSATRQELAKLRESQEKLLVQSVEGDRYQQAVSLMNRSQSRMLTMTGSGTVAGASGSVVITPDQNRAVLMVEKMPPPPPGKVYHLWAVVNGQKVACIQFAPEADGRVFMSIPANRWNAATQVAITVEPEQSGTQPTGDMVMSGEKI